MAWSTELLCPMDMSAHSALINGLVHIAALPNGHVYTQCSNQWPGPQSCFAQWTSLHTVLLSMAWSTELLCPMDMSTHSALINGLVHRAALPNGHVCTQCSNQWSGPQSCFAQWTCLHTVLLSMAWSTELLCPMDMSAHSALNNGLVHRAALSNGYVCIQCSNQWPGPQSCFAQWTCLHTVL